MQTPPIDPRDRDTLAAQTSALAQRYSSWRPRTDGGADAGQALMAIFARFAQVVVDRINRAPERNYLAFLNLIGIEPLPPRPARVPLTFTLAEGSPGAAVVPAGTQVAAPALEGEADDLVFETETPLVVSRSQLQAVFVGDAETDTYSDRTGAAHGLPDEPYPAFSGDRPVPHQLYVACDQLLTSPGTKNVTIAMASPTTGPWTSWPLAWSRWDGETWQPLPFTGEFRDGAWRVTFPALPQLVPHVVSGVEAGWLRLSLEMGLPRGESGLEPESVAVGGRDPADPELPLAPFGETSQVKWFYLSADEALAAGSATARFQVGLDRAGAANVRNPVTLIWSYKAGPDWRELGRSSSVAEQVAVGEFGLRDGTQGLTRGGEISFRLPVSWPRTVHRSRLGRWLRVEIADAGGSYTTLPRIGSLTAGYGWDLPQVSRVTAQVNTPPATQPSPAAYNNSTPLDLTKDFYPFGEQPRFNDTFTIACPDELARPGAEVTLMLTVNPARPARTEGTRRLSWEVPDGPTWRVLTTTTALGGAMRVTWPQGFAPAEINSEERHWLRVRLVDGDYGGPAGYDQVPAQPSPTDTVTYRLKPATWAPPVLQSASWTATAAAASTPASGIVSANDFVYRSHPSGLPFTPFTTGDDHDPALYLGFDQPFDRRPATLYLQVEPPAPEEVAADQLAEIDPTTRPQVVWEYSGPDGWRPLDAVDETGAMASRGLVRFVGPADLTPREYFGQRRCWLRARWRRGYFPFPPRLRRVLLNTTWAAQVSTVDGEILGASNGNPAQEFSTAQAPVQPGEELVVREDDGVDQPDEAWERWSAVPDFHHSGAADRHYTIDRLAGVIRFGDGTAGCIPPRGPNNVCITYRTGGGVAGNRAVGTIAQLKSGIPLIDSVTNHEPAQGGAPTEALDRLSARGPRVLRHRDRAITGEDLEDLAFAASADVVRVAAVVPTSTDPTNLWLAVEAPIPRDDHRQVAAGRVGVIIVPDTEDRRPTPSLGLLRQVHDHLRARTPATTEVWVAGPEWIRVTVSAGVVPRSPLEADAVRTRVREAVERFLHPLTGGADGEGWAFGRKPHRSELFAVVEAVDGVDHVRSLEVVTTPESSTLAPRLEAVLDRTLTELREPTAADLQRWLARALVYSGDHNISAVLGSR